MKFKTSIIVFSAIILAACSGAGVSGPTLTPIEQQGQAVYTLRCAQCHALTPDTVVIGPSLAGIATRAASRVPGYDTQTYLETSILIPEDYVPDLDLRMGLYRRLNEVEDRQEIEAFAAELIDRFGKLPEPTENLLTLIEAIGTSATRRASMRLEHRPLPGIFRRSRVRER